MFLPETLISIRYSKLVIHYGKVHGKVWERYRCGGTGRNAGYVNAPCMPECPQSQEATVRVVRVVRVDKSRRDLQ